MDNSDIGFRRMAKENVLTTEETCRILGRTRQQLNNLLRQKKIEVFKETSNSNLFWRPDIYELRRKLERECPRRYHEILGYSTKKSLEAFHRLKLNKDDVEEIYVFGNWADAIQKNFFNVCGEEMPDTLTNIEAARFILVMKDGEEHWFGALTCGYCGEGCRGTQIVLEELGVLDSCENDGSQVASIISGNRIVHFYREGGYWQIENEVSVVDDEDSFRWEKNGILMAECDFFRYNGRLVLTQGLRVKMTLGDVRVPDIEVLEKCFFFIPNPVSVELFSKEEALRSGRYRFTRAETYIYQICIRDSCERELWIAYPIEDVITTKPQSMRDLFGALGIEVEEETLTDKIRIFLGICPRKIFRRYSIGGEN